MNLINRNEAEVHEYVNTVRDMVRHEDLLLNQRLTWMWALEGLLFNAAGMFWKYFPIVLLVAFVGIVSSFSIWYSLIRGLRAIRSLLELSAERKWSICGGRRIAPTIGARKKAIGWMLPANLIPWMFIVAWVLLVIIRLKLTLF